MSVDRGEQVRAPSDSRLTRRLRTAVIDRDSGFTHVVDKRITALGWEHRTLSSAVTIEALLTMRLSALAIDLTVVEPDSWDYLGSVCRRLPALGVIVCTRPSSVAQRVRGLRLGADAWITKPCHPEELICVFEAVVRRHRRRELIASDPPRMFGELSIRTDLHQVRVGAQDVGVTAKEFALLQLLSESDRVLRREEIYERVWGYAMVRGDRSVDVFVRKLRQKLHSASPGWNYIHTHFGVGYRFSAEQVLEAAPAVELEAEAGSGVRAGAPAPPPPGVSNEVAPALPLS